MRRPLIKVLRKALTIVAVVAAAGVLAVELLFAALWLEHNSPLELPRPTGPFAVGRISTTWTDTARMDPFAPPPARPRELVVWIWYPAQRSARAQTAEYLPGPWRRALAKHAGVLLTHFLFRDPTKVRCHSVENAGLAQASRSYPVVIFRSGIGALAFQYTTLVEDLASHGYIVVSADTPYSTSVVVMPDGRVIQRTIKGNPGDAPISQDERVRLTRSLIGVWTADTRFLLDQVARMNEDDPSGKLTGKMNLDAVGIAGHSLGGATAAQFCHDDSRCRAGIDIDGQLFGRVREGMGQPFLFLLSDHGDVWASPDCRICAEIRSTAKRAPRDKLIVTMLGAHHFSFGDQALTQSRILRSALVTISGQGGLDPRTGLESTCRYVRELFDVHLRGAPRKALYSAPLVAGVRFERK
ncbi:MAG TPA: family membership [Thermoanaerobaculia bacterium]|jgi:dienelactone hydrolase|nr:family membership [Thermoanaerobaculia bacterium]